MHARGKTERSWHTVVYLYVKALKWFADPLGGHKLTHA